jgi:hypothetical protein
MKLKPWSFLLCTTLLAGFAITAQADVHVGIGIAVAPPVVVAPPVYYSPPPDYYAPPTRRFTTARESLWAHGVAMTGGIIADTMSAGAMTGGTITMITITDATASGHPRHAFRHQHDDR